MVIYLTHAESPFLQVLGEIFTQVNISFKQILREKKNDLFNYVYFEWLPAKLRKKVVLTVLIY